MAIHFLLFSLREWCEVEAVETGYFDQKKRKEGSGGWGKVGVLRASGGGILLLFLGKEGSSSMGP